MTLEANSSSGSINHRAASPQGGMVITLKITDDRVVLEQASSTDVSAPITHEVGGLRRILAVLGHEPATAGELEAAIHEIEEMIIPVIPLLPPSVALAISAPLVHELADIVGRRGDPEPRLETAIVEEVFGRLVSMACGMPASQLGIPEHRNFAVTVLLLRELMHHAGFPSVLLLGS